MQKHLAFFFLLLCLALTESFAQSANVPLWSDYYHLLDRYEIKSGKMHDGYFSSFKPTLRQSVAAFTDSVSSLGVFESSSDKFNEKYLRQDNWEFFTDSLEAAPTSKKPILKYFYRTSSDAFHVGEDGIDLHVSPVFQFDVGHDPNSPSTPFINTRGIVVRGRIDEKLGFYTYLTENQAVFPAYTQRWIDRWHVVPNEGFWKRFGEAGTDYITANGYLTFSPTKHIQLQAGHDKLFVGNGMRSMFLSDFSNNYFFLRFNAKIWKFNYTNVIARLKADVFYYNDGLLGTKEFPNKNLVMHQLNWQVTKNFNVGLFEAVMFSPEDSLRTGSFDPNYLNPFIFYRGLEQQLGSPDNVLVGFDAKWNFARHFSAYGQFLLDELSFTNLKNKTGWWSNKYAYQLGLKWVDVGNISNLDLQLEHNYARPYTYAHQSSYTSFTHYRQPLANPLGANFKEWVAVLRYQPIGKLQLTARAMLASQGEDILASNWGRNPLLPYATFEREFGNFTGQGVATKINLVGLQASYQLLHNLFIDARFIYRKEQQESISLRNNDQFFGFGIRLNTDTKHHYF
ncbi:MULTISPECIES: hypothetical protein [unclassified Imperialibacter]|uniref:hypothetical protein n=1 Tax=unclassified Imperialibacter TaxID=2629706 RepID=UPI001258D11C|nr:MULTISPECIES: hypothetical protein [unclassified Imperialibacter]CAD5272034.1 conserved exported hypothetical protein [Imperialibacter sp. 89]CAD5299186.1 conserved exported hypothetical protein [Imperialibacter sp. 75]VVT35156.1 conserved exported hypothetical protein [Imperialibacter sp. EC-SDR9]